MITQREKTIVVVCATALVALGVWGLSNFKTGVVVERCQDPWIGTTYLVRESVGLIRCDDWITGTAFVVDHADRHTILVTAAHVVESADMVEIVFLDREPVAASRWISHDTVDIAYVYIPKVDIPKLPIRGQEVYLAEKVLICGAPFSTSDVLSYGRVGRLSKIHDYWGHELYFVNVWAAPGNSGSPVCDEKGRVVGVLVGGFNSSGASMSFCVPNHLWSGDILW